MGAPATSVRTRPARSAPAQRVSTPSKRVRSTAGAAAPARKKAPARRPAAAPARRSRVTPPAGVVRLPATAVAGTAGAVSGIADSPFVVGMTRSRLWIGVLAVLLGGIVAIQVLGLSLSAQSSANAEKIDELRQEQSVLGGRIARRGSLDKIQQVAAAEGLDTVAPKGIRYVESGSSDAADAAKRLSGEEIAKLATLATTSDAGSTADTAATAAAATPTYDSTGAQLDPATGLPIDPATGAPSYDANGMPIDPATGAPIDPTALAATTTTTTAAVTP